jgi:two-component system phosphate regulon sensor histidine kinase PhoR
MEVLGWLVALAIGVWSARRRRRADAWAARLRAHWQAAATARPETGPGEADDAAGEGVRLAAAETIDQLWDEIESARDESRRLRAVIAGMVEGVLVIDRSGQILLTNPRLEEMLGLTAGEDYYGRPLEDACRHPDLHELVRFVMSEAEWDRSLVQEVSIRGGRDLTLQVTASPLTNGEGVPRAFVLVFHDITALRQLERVRRDFVANVSHELRTPLAAIGGYTETLLSGALDEPERARRFLEIIERHSNRLGRLVDDLLTLSDLELGRTELQRAPQDLSAVVDACFETLRAKAVAAGITLENAIAEKTPPVDADADRLEQAVLNLVDNAIKYTPSGGHVRLSSSVLNGSQVPRDVAIPAGARSFVEIAVADTGVGVPPEDLSRLTERFYRVDKARSRELGGTGLGLAIVKHIVQAHGGWMRIESELHKGTTLHLFLPAAVEATSSASPRATR